MRSVLRSGALKRKLSDFDSCDSHLIRYDVSVNVHGGADVRVSDDRICARRVFGEGDPERVPYVRISVVLGFQVRRLRVCVEILESMAT